MSETSPFGTCSVTAAIDVTEGHASVWPVTEAAQPTATSNTQVERTLESRGKELQK